MSPEIPEPRRFFGERLPQQFNHALEDQERRAGEAAGEDAEAARRLLEAMRVDTTLRVIVQGEGGGTFHLNVSAGRMTSDDAPAGEPILTLVQDRTAYERVVQEAGDSAMGFLGGLSGLAGEMRLTRGRIENLRGLQGALRFEVTGPEGFALLTHFGPDPIPDEPTTTLSVAPDTYRELRAGQLDPQAAFMGGRIQIAGDMQLAMQLALAALSPD